MSSPLRVALLVVSDTAAKDPSTDASGEALGQLLADEGSGKWELVETKIVADNVTQIQRQLMLWADVAAHRFNLILTTGGTGFAVSDNTPEAVAALLHRKAPGLVHAMLAASLSVTPFAMMSRPVAGVRHQSVIVTLPGSPKGAKENLQAIIKTLPHACVQAAGANSRAIHAGGVKKLEADAGLSSTTEQSSAQPHAHHHHHAHGHGHNHGHGGHGHGGLVRHTKPGSNPISNDPSLGPSRRNRESPFPMLPVADALAKISENTPAPEIITSKVDSNLPGHVLAQDVTARENVPAFRASIVDGYAVVVPRDGNMKGVFPVVSVSHATPGEVKPLNEGEIARITTGAPLPPGATSVIMVEDTILKTMTDDGKEEKEVEILADNVKEGENIREVGSDIKAESVILSKGEQASAQGGEIGLLAAVGVSEVKTYRKPVVGVLSTGDEIVDHDRPGDLRYGEVRDTNRITLISAAKEAGYAVVDLGIAGDKPGTLEETLRDSLRRVDLVITTGGVSMGELDLLKPTIERALGGTIHFGRVAMKPGKPTTFATVPVKQTESGARVDKVIFSLPGNPASAIVSFHLFVLPALQQMSGVEPAGLTRLPVVLAHDFPLDKSRVEYHRAIVSVSKDGVIRATSTGGQRSSKVGSLKGANALLCLPQGSEPLKSGATVEALLMGGIRSDF
ncbi:molybdenum cofactor synthesis domain-containing protein [Microdochium trichocladiopsis]|uniref:Molybdenum cofactor synthesis domain-containing protein n=1 Tax=Microdochium trichocladiopsis TaxID=1682393 RepID=A0A9P8Y6V2_9PEZI|nr:molybdenum cofactor synthesis domain-containing protein [Microdochium trichocladiopsis]KAH7031240.1 molybdenum cofactor synthesis domain-containing protein [Microdochium trichocladiopsis]